MVESSNANDWIERMRATFPNSALGYLEIDLLEIDSDKIGLSMPITDKTRQPFGLLHGGINMVLAESAASIHACWGIDLDEYIPLGIEISASHVRSASEGVVLANGHVIRRSRSLIVHQVEIVHKASRELLSTARVTNFYKTLKE